MSNIVMAYIIMFYGITFFSPQVVKKKELKGNLDNIFLLGHIIHNNVPFIDVFFKTFL